MIENKNVRAVGETTISDLPAALKMLQTMVVPVDTKDPTTQGVTTERVSLSDILKLFEAIGTLPPVGMPQLWATPNIPVGYLEFNGDSFDMELYPELALVFPSGKLPDWRGRVPKCVPIGGSIGDFEEDGIKAHDHKVSVAKIDLGTVRTNDYTHTHPLNRSYNVHQGAFAPARMDDVEYIPYSFARGGIEGQPTHLNHGSWGVAADVHSHSIPIGEHAHEASCSSVGASETTVKGVFVTVITRAR